MSVLFGGKTVKCSVYSLSERITMSLSTIDKHLPIKRNLCIVYCGIIWLIYLPISLYGIVRFYKYRQNIILRKRHSLITIYLLISFLLLMAIFLPLILIAYANSRKFLDFDQNLRWHKYGIYSFYPMVIFLFQILYIFIWRQWLYYYDILFIRYTANKEWTQFLNPMSYKDNFFLNAKNKKRYGSTSNSESLFYKIMIILFLLTASSIIIWTILFDYNSIYLRIGSASTSFFWFILCILLVIILRCKTPKFEDGLFIRREVNYWIYIVIIFAIIIIADLCVDYLYFVDYKISCHCINVKLFFNGNCCIFNYFYFIDLGHL